MLFQLFCPLGSWLLIWDQIDKILEFSLHIGRNYEVYEVMRFIILK